MADIRILELLEKHGEDLLATRFARLDDSAQLRQIADEVTHGAIETMLRLEVPNLHELNLDRVIAYGHTWSPVLELSPEQPFFHGHAIAIDMALSATLALHRGYIPESERDRLFWLMSRLGLALDSPELTPELLARATEAIVQTRHGRLRAAMPRPLGQCFFVNDLSAQELEDGLGHHREAVTRYPRAGRGLDMFTS